MWMHKIGLALLLATVPLSSACGQAMPVSTFLGKADALQKKGAMALFSSDIGKLKAEVVNSGKQLRAEQIGAQKAGRKVGYCMPERGKSKIGSNEVLAHFRSIPAAQRGMTVKAAFAGLMRKKYPCAG
jgi:hypothetical protein